MSDTFESVDLDRLRSGFGVKWGLDDDLLNAWVADMDFGIPGPVRARLREVVDREDFGYPHWPGGDPVVAAFEQRMRDRYGWAPEPGRTRVFTDLIQILQVVIEHATAPGDGIALHVPNYPPFLASIHRAGRRPVPLPVLKGERGWEFPVDARRLRDEGCTMLLLVNPHNPTGRVFRREELRAFADAARELDLVVLSDEIHADLTYDPHRHVPFASLDDDTAARTITATSATKAFNLAATRCAVAHVGHEGVRRELDRAPLDYFGTPSLLGRVATVAAWRESEDWHRRLMHRLTRNRDLVADWSRESDVDCVPPEATYLAWLDFSRTGLTDPADAVLRAGVRLSPGPEFAQHTAVDAKPFARLNFATSEDLLLRVLAGIDGAVNG
ncbi:cystathione beta-lyase [Amycolatopsis sacchari]|uniref:cysteine-S-conjugate beta-lyase n=1 Tax=Amycolatopsis sacchari TaxID=115433 RepID=A0A1I3VLL6_9PSEU|nr:aminotransferase class I/II-fold pyridoxal phosphate-dependent enzyme [Amycolatopsis sacchari]SFJ95979.1 cystathione beta-lyase [Amycolatopsis sacchari]